MVLAAATVVAFFLTRGFAAANVTMRNHDAAAWYTRAQEDLQNGRTEEAVTALRRATAKDPANRRYRIALAGALAATHHDTEARQVLQGLRQAQPDDADTNLQLARLEAAAGDAATARRYYQNAIAALWRPEQAPSRTAARIELIRFLLRHDERSRALAELLALNASRPEDVRVDIDVGRLFLDAGDTKRALDCFRQALQTDPHDGGALAGAGDAAFEGGDYASAARYLAAAPATDRTRQRLTISNLVLDNDPLARRLSAPERHRRVQWIVGQASEAVNECTLRLANQPEPRRPLEALQREIAALDITTASRAALDPRDLTESSLDLAYRAARAVEQACGNPSVANQAVLLIGRRHEER
jgi:tetratricopeptide (TPR) repeat protein